jgi:hypothetical protein
MEQSPQIVTLPGLVSRQFPAGVLLDTSPLGECRNQGDLTPIIMTKSERIRNFLFKLAKKIRITMFHLSL